RCGRGGRHRDRPRCRRARDRERRTRFRAGARGRRRPPRRAVKKIAIVVQRYGADINGGAEVHARYVAEHLARHVQVEVLTTCAKDYVTWRNALPAGTETVNGITVRRFPVSRERTPDEFGRWSRRVFEHRHSLRDELTWLDVEG